MSGEGPEAAGEFDHVIVGAGSAGCVLAHRLTEEADRTVLLLEAGGRDNAAVVRMPAALAIPMHSPRFSWTYRAEPEPELGGRSLICPRGRVLGGSSSINGMVYVRGNALDFEGWVDAGADGWGYRDVLPYFRRAECFAGGGDRWRGDAGPLRVANGTLSNPLHRAFLDAARQAGWQAPLDINGFRQEGFGPLPMTVHRGVRWSTAQAYLRPALGRANLTVITGGLATRLVMDGRQTRGVEFVRRGRSRRVLARRSVILCAGPINGPQLLMLSGIGPGQHLAERGIAVKHDLPGVGANLQDHLEVYVQQACVSPVTLHRHAGLLGKAWAGVRWIATRRGVGASNHFETGGFIRSSDHVAWPDIQFHFFPMAVSYDGKRSAGRHGFQAHVGPMRSKSRGYVRLRSADPLEPPEIRFNYMSCREDWVEMRAAVRAARRIFAQPAFDPYRGPELAPGEGRTSDRDIDAFVRETAESAFHPCGTARMGKDAKAVVDPDCRVHGIDRLLVVDSSVMPVITTGNLNAPTIMMAEKAADMIRGRDPLPASDAPFFRARNGAGGSDCA